MRIQLTDEAARQIAEQLAYDDGFREALQRDPRSALAPFHIELEEEDLRKVARLPSKTKVKEAIRAVEIVEQNEEKGNYDMIGFLFSVFPRPARPEAKTTRKKAGKARSAARKK